ncbi:aspartate kinase [Clostridium sp. DMHC 10]|uniref:aspartate kinase n=1 Tax=Clostridium sp. DMHC 10 TaxID=747377 RepID=UPI00069EDABC|nr:aspartate kinase [Clostridium sp. DMHC 10]KOF56706.1 aspartate kinase [Clostridium sp. DMHC 10]
MKLIVQKFGGTSVSNHERRKCVVNKVLDAQKKGYSPIVIVSAMGRKGEPYATDTLLSLVNEEFKSNNKLAVDLLMCCGELISAVVVSSELNENGIKAVPFTGGQAGIITDDNYNNASVKTVDPYCLMETVKSGKVPVIAGFQGKSEKGFFTTLGRGGSDVTASIVGCAVRAEKIEIYTDVDGIMTADPRIVRGASLIEKISYNELFEFAQQGAKVIHPRAVEIAMNGNVPLVVKNTLSDCKGTLINDIGEIEGKELITGITCLSGRIQVEIKLKDNKSSTNYGDILNILALNGISIDLINLFPRESVFTINESSLIKFQYIMDKFKIIYSITKNCSKISIIGNKICGVPGVMAKILKALTKEDIEVLQTADSHTTIWCLIKSSEKEKAVNALHNEFNLCNK